jgi:endonuclease III
MLHFCGMYAKKYRGKKFKERKRRVQSLLHTLQALYPHVGTLLRFSNNFELLVSVILSAQCTDKKVNEVTEKLFKEYKTLDDYVAADPKRFEQDIKSTGFYRNKTKHILGAARMVRDQFNGKVPDTMEAILTIPGVARKTANVVLGNAYDVVKGIAVDTHVRRFALKFDLTDSKNPNDIEQDLMELIPHRDWFSSTNYFIEYGRTICPARKHDCIKHPLTVLYPPAAKRWPASR